MSYSTQIVEAFEDYFREKELIYTHNDSSDEDEYVINFKTNLKCKVQNAHEYIIIRDKSFSIIATIPIKADEDHRLAVAEYLTRVNYNLRVGNFELDMSDGEVRFKDFAFIGDGPVQKELLIMMLLIPLHMIERFADGLLSVLFDFSTPLEAYEAAQK